MQEARSQGDRSARRAQHLSEKAMRQQETVGSRSIPTGQEPAGKPLLDIVQPVTDGGLRGLHEKRLHVSLQNVSQLAGPLKFLLQNFRLYAKARTLDLNECSSWCSAGTEQNRNTDDSITTNHTDLDSVAIFYSHDYRRDAIFQEIGMRKLSIQESLFLFQSHRRKVRREIISWPR